MINYDDIEEGKIITGIAISGQERTGVCTNVMKRLRMATVQYGADRLDNDIVEFGSVTNIEENDND